MSADELVDGIPEHLHVDMTSVITYRLGASGGEDEAQDWVTDLMVELAPLIARALADTAPEVLWEGETTFLGSRSNPRQDASWFVPPYPFAVEGHPPGTRVAVVAVPVAVGEPEADGEQQ